MTQPERVFKADYRDCLELAAALAESIEKADGSWCYEGDDLLGQFIPHISPVIGELEYLRRLVPYVQHKRECEVNDDEVCHCGELMRTHTVYGWCTSPRVMERVCTCGLAELIGGEG